MKRGHHRDGTRRLDYDRGSIYLRQHLRLRGAGKCGSTSGGSEIVSCFNGNALSFSEVSDTLANVMIENLSIIGDKNTYNTGHGIYLNHVFNVTMTDVTVGQFPGDCFHVEYGWHIYFRDTYAGDPAGIGYYINSPHCDLQRCSSDGGQYSLKTDAEGYQVTIRGCHFEGATSAGILLQGGASHKIIGNYITGPPIGILDGLTTSPYPYRVEIVGNSICCSGGSSIWIKLTNGSSYMFTIVGNYIVANTGIKVNNWGWDTITGNSIEGTYAGLDVSPQDVNQAVTVTGNSINGGTYSVLHNAGNKTIYTGNSLAGAFSRAGGIPTIMNPGNAGTVTLAASATTTVNNSCVTGNSKIFLFPTNAAAANLVQGSKSPYVSAQTAGTSFAITTADGTAAAGTEMFNYMVID